MNNSLEIYNAFEQLYSSEFPLFCDHSVLIHDVKNVKVLVCNGMELDNKSKGFNSALPLSMINNKEFNRLLNEYQNYLFSKDGPINLFLSKLLLCLHNNKLIEETIGLLLNEGDKLNGTIVNNVIKKLKNGITNNIAEESAKVCLEEFLKVYISTNELGYPVLSKLFQKIEKPFELKNIFNEKFKTNIIKKYLIKGRLDKLVIMMGEIFECQSFGGFLRSVNSPYVDPTPNQNTYSTLINSLTSVEPDIIIMVEGFEGFETVDGYKHERFSVDNMSPVTVIYKNKYSVTIQPISTDHSTYSIRVEDNEEPLMLNLLSVHSKKDFTSSMLKSFLNKNTGYDLICGDFNLTKSKSKNDGSITLEEAYAKIEINNTYKGIFPNFKIQKMRIEMNILANNQIHKGGEIVSEIDGMGIFVPSLSSGMGNVKNNIVEVKKLGLVGKLKKKLFSKKGGARRTRKVKKSRKSNKTRKVNRTRKTRKSKKSSKSGKRTRKH